MRIFCGSLDDIAAVRARDTLDDFFRGGVNEVGGGLFAVRRGLFDDLVGVYSRIVHSLREAAFRLADFCLFIPLFQCVINDLDDFRLDRNTIARKLDRYRIAQRGRGEARYYGALLAFHKLRIFERDTDNGLGNAGRLEVGFRVGPQGVNARGVREIL